ncbi:MAG: AMP-binding protein, partial [Gammaproteobacteria bacterium]|nr:AMP-binding protein [Gammaproteobacteria bacterium]
QAAQYDFGYGLKALHLPFLQNVDKPRHTHKITFTSGSTGQAKGVCLSNEQQLTVADSLVTGIAIERPHHLCILPLATLLENIAGVYSPLISGGSIYVPSLSTLGFSGSSQVEAGKLLACIDHCQPETMILIPQLLNLLIISVMQGWQPPKELKMMAVGGSRVAASAIKQARKLGLPVYEGYGLSECASVVSLNTPDHDQPGSAGQLLPHLKIEISNGEINIVGNSFLGYLDEPDSWYPSSVATGDLGYIDDQGFIQLQGRKKNLLISSYGRNINPEWVESEILAHPLIQQCIVVGDAKPHCSALIYADSKHISDREIQSWLDQVRPSLPDYAQVQSWLHLASPLTSTNNLLTANGRPRREAINSYYSSEIEKLYPQTKERNQMSFFQRLQNETVAERETFFTAPIIQQCLSGQVTLPDYIAFLTEAYHHVKHTTPLLMAVGSRIPEEKEWLRNAVAEYIEEELGHQEWILNDIAACGVDKEEVRHGKPALATELMVAYAYDMVQRVNPLGFFGMVHVLEGSSVTTADIAADSIQKGLNLPDKAFSYLRSHGALDQEHVKFFEQLMDRIEDPAEQDCIIHSAKVFYRLYGDIFRGLTALQNLTEAA